MLKPGQVAKAAKISTSTLRRYINRYGRHFSPSATRPKGREFSQEDMALVLRIRELYLEGLSLNEIDARLGVVGDGRADTNKIISLLPDIAQPLSEALDTTRANRARLGNIENKLEELGGNLGSRLENLSSQLQEEREARRQAEIQFREEQKRNRRAWIVFGLIIISIVVFLIIVATR